MCTLQAAYCLGLKSIRDMANVSLDWEVDGIITAEESVSAMLETISTKTIKHTGTFWTWEGKASVSMYGSMSY